MRRVVVVTAADAGQRLDTFLNHWLPATIGRPLSKSAIRRLIMAGVVSVAGQVWRKPGAPLTQGARVSVAIDERRLPAPARPHAPPTFGVEAILYEDRWLLAVDKPPNLPTVPTADPSRSSLVALIRRHLAATASTGANPYLAVHQRLDRDTSGIVLFATHVDANKGLADAFAGRAVRKTYVALTARPSRLPPRRWSVAGTYTRSGAGRRSRLERSAASDGRHTATTFERVEVFARALVVHAEPHTGRRHQIRAQLAECDAPILGDDRYDDRESAPRAPRAPRMMLHAMRLALRHPVTGAPVVIESPLPPDLSRMMAMLRAERA